MVGLGAGLANGLVYGVAFGLGAGLVVGFMGGTEYRPPTDPRHVIHDDAIFGLTGGLAVVLVGLTDEPTRWLINELVDGVVVGFVVGLVGSLASVRFLCACILFTLQGTFPRRPVLFLQWAYQARLLRITGGAYQFRYNTYQDWLTRQSAAEKIDHR